MAGNITTIITKINKACDDLDFVSARVLIETNLLKLSEAKQYRLLNFKWSRTYKTCTSK